MSIKDFFVSYTAVDRAWAEWIAWQLEAAGYSTVVQAWDFSPGSNWVHEMDRAAATATRTIAVLSPAYLNSVYGEVEWQSALRKDPTGEQRLLIPIRVAVVDVPGLLASRVYVDFVERDTEAARQALLAAIQQQRAKPSREPSFPGVQPGLPGKAPAFPGTTTTPKISNPSGIQSDQVEETKDEQDDSHIASGSRSITNEPNSQSALDPRSAPGIHVEFQTDLDHGGSRTSLLAPRAIDLSQRPGRTSRYGIWRKRS